MKKNFKLPTIIGIFVLILGLGAGITLLNREVLFGLRASPTTEPQDVRITNVTDRSFSVSWTTDKKTAGFVIYGAGTNANTNVPAPDSAAKNIHSLEVTGLAANTDYVFKINSDGVVKDNNGIAWKVKTGPALQAAANQITISGTVIDSSGNAVPNALVYVNTQGSSMLSSQASENGSWVIPLSRLRTSNNSSFLATTNQTLLEVFVQAGKTGIATAQVYVGSANPVPPIVLGQTHDFRNEKANNSVTTPQSDLTLPEETTKTSQFNVTGEKTTSTPVTLESVETGETLNTDTPEFFGEGPANTEITITVHSSQEIVDTVKVGQTGDWNWTPPTNLEPGPHTITLSWKDAKGILRTLTRSFVVEAKEGPAFVSTPSASPRSSTTPKPSSSPKSSGSPTPRASASATPKTTMPASDSGTPVAGVGTPTIVLLVTGLTFISLSAYIAKRSFEL